jgi:hypothetical protein
MEPSTSRISGMATSRNAPDFAILNPCVRLGYGVDQTIQPKAAAVRAIWLQDEVNGQLTCAFSLLPQTRHTKTCSYFQHELCGWHIDCRGRRIELKFANLNHVRFPTFAMRVFCAKDESIYTSQPRDLRFSVVVPLRAALLSRPQCEF